MCDRTTCGGATCRAPKIADSIFIAAASTAGWRPNNPGVKRAGRLGSVTVVVPVGSRGGGERDLERLKRVRMEGLSAGVVTSGSSS